ncbi:hypothetical protein ABT173_15015 [Streptomyces sp. NPDC001795]|uniref:hypothetical protein n=1 Tax=Streptomyces sp. NPDC001795 TaxID=3154525 RepID=UPI00332DA489
MRPKVPAGIAAVAVAADLLLRLGMPPLWLVLIALVAACPLSMALMPGGHSGHGGHGGRPHGCGSEPGDGHQHGECGGTGLTQKGP